MLNFLILVYRMLFSLSKLYSMKTYTFKRTRDGRYRADVRHMDTLNRFVYLDELARGSMLLQLALTARSYKVIVGATVVTMYHDKYNNIILRYEDYGKNSLSL